MPHADADWIVRNSWEEDEEEQEDRQVQVQVRGLFWYLISAVGTGWGESGYMLIAMNKYNICGVLSMPVGLCTGKAFEEEIAVY